MAAGSSSLEWMTARVLTEWSILDDLLGDGVSNVPRPQLRLQAVA
jgi:hypothetical protein